MPCCRRSWIRRSRENFNALAEDLPDFNALAQEIVDDLQTALEQFSAVVEGLKV